ncbi:hypothetical protein [Clostridium weizhouense]|uniref:Tail fiber protein n=1 Tax=Clostridium weizhouense TaxID=2859781 RepID=A0ABS7AJZ3_9CLOT|nr:hypothetical protein [Clostridium weizhouense]MBW6408957.1 hypothetical protein [Clostridium weizhouense]
MEISKFNEKLNRIDGNIYTIEEIVTLIDGVYEAELIHDNVNLKTLNIYTGSKLTGTKINTYSTSTPSLTPWKTIIKIFSKEPKLYISYETTGDQVEAEDINNLQDSVNLTQKELNSEIDRATKKENEIEKNLNSEIERAKVSEKIISDNLASEVNRSTNAEKLLTDNLNTEINRSKSAEKTLTDNLNTEISRATKSEDIINKNLIEEVSRSKAAEKSLNDNINNTNNSLNTEINRAKKEEESIKSTFNSNKPNWDDAYNKRHIHSNKSILDGLGESTTGDLTFKGGKIVSTTVNGLTDDIILEGGNNVTVSKTGNKIVVSTAGGQEKIVTNTPINVSQNDWILDNNSGTYNVIVQHNLNDTNIIIGVYNGTQKLELVGIKIKDANSIILSNNEPIDCKVIINSSGQPTEVIDNLNSSDSNKALSAKQGKVLKDLVSAVQGGVSIGKTLEDAKPISLFFEIID